VLPNPGRFHGFPDQNGHYKIQQIVLYCGKPNCTDMSDQMDREDNTIYKVVINTKNNIQYGLPKGKSGRMEGSREDRYKSRMHGLYQRSVDRYAAAFT